MDFTRISSEREKDQGPESRERGSSRLGLFGVGIYSVVAVTVGALHSSQRMAPPAAHHVSAFLASSIVALRRARKDDGDLSLLGERLGFFARSHGLHRGRPRRNRLHLDGASGRRVSIHGRRRTREPHRAAVRMSGASVMSPRPVAGARSTSIGGRSVPPIEPSASERRLPASLIAVRHIC